MEKALNLGVENMSRKYITDSNVLCQKAWSLYEDSKGFPEMSDTYCK